MIPIPTEETEVPIALVRLVEQRIQFWCPNTTPCLPEINLENRADLLPPYDLGPIFYANSSSVFGILYLKDTATDPRVVFHLNPQTGELNSIKLPGSFRTALFQLVGGQLVAVENEKTTVLFIHADLSIRTTTLNFPVDRIIAANALKIIALNRQPVIKDGEVFIKFATIDINSGQINAQSLALPELKLPLSQIKTEAGNKYLVEIEGISRDLENIYCLFYDGEVPNELRLGKFNFTSGKEVVSTQEAGLIKLTSGYAQYHELLYTSSFGGAEGAGAGASLITTATMSSLLDFEHQPELRSSKLILNPFGDAFLVGTDSHVLLLSPDGKIIQKYPLPEDWIGQDYSMVYYEN